MRLCWTFHQTVYFMCSLLHLPFPLSISFLRFYKLLQDYQHIWKSIFKKQVTDTPSPSNNGYQYLKYFDGILYCIMNHLILLISLSIILICLYLLMLLWIFVFENLCEDAFFFIFMEIYTRLELLGHLVNLLNFMKSTTIVLKVP